MEEIRDCLGRLACKGDAATGFVESSYHGQKTSTHLPLGYAFTVQRGETKTVITRSSETSFQIESGPSAT